MKLKFLIIRSENLKGWTQPVFVEAARPCQGLCSLKITITIFFVSCSGQKLFKVKDRVKDSVCILPVNLCEIYFNGLCDLAKTDNIVFCQSPPPTDFTKESKALGFYCLIGDNIISISGCNVSFSFERTATS